MHLFDGAPNENGTLIASSDPSFSCGTVFATLPDAGSYWVIVEGAREDDEGIFELVFACQPLAAEPVTEACADQLLTCGDSHVGTTIGYPDW